MDKNNKWEKSETIHEEEREVETRAGVKCCHHAVDGRATRNHKGRVRFGFGLGKMKSRRKKKKEEANGEGV